MTAWSYSALSAYETCPKRYFLTRVTRAVVERPSTATEEGNAVHKALELYVKGERELPAKYESYRAMAERIKNSPGEELSEQKVALTKDFKPTTFFAKDVWLRAVLDVVIVRDDSVIVLDYKTGKRKFDHDQLELFAATSFTLWPFVNRVQTGYIWLKEGKVDRKDYTPSEAPVIWQNYKRRVSRIEHSLETGDWPARPSGLCRNWCPVGRSRCEHCGAD